MKAVKVLLGACLEALGEMLVLLLFVIMAAGFVVVLGAIILLDFVWDKTIKLKRAMKR